MATVSIEAHKGCQTEGGQLKEGCDTGIDAVYLIGREWPVPKRVGFVGREPGSPVQLIVPVSESDRRAILAAVEARHQQAATAVQNEAVKK